MALALALRLPGYTESVWFDELFTSNIYCGETLILKTLYSDIHPPTYFIFIHYWNALFGDSEVWLRLPPLVCGLLSIPLIARVGRLFAGVSAGRMAAFLMAVSPVHIWYSQEARPYATNMFLVLLTTLTFYRLMGDKKCFFGAILFFLSLVLTVFTHYYLAAFPFVYGALAVRRESPNRGRVLVACITVVAMVGVYMGAKTYFSNVPTSMTYLRSFDEMEAWRLCFQWFLTGNALTPVDGDIEFGAEALLALQGLALVTFLGGCWRLASRRPRPGAPFGLDVVAYLAVLPVALFGMSLLGLNQTYIERSALPSLPFFIVVLAAGLTMWRAKAFVAVRSVLLAAAVGLVLFSFHTHRDLWTVYKPNPDWREAAALLSGEIDTADERIVLYSDYVSPTPLRYYDPRMQEAKRFTGGDKEARLAKKVKDTLGETSFPGKQVTPAVLDYLERFKALNEAAEQGMRLEIRDLKRRDPRAEKIYEYWVLVHREPSDKAKALIADPSQEVVLERAFRQLLLYKVRAKP